MECSVCPKRNKCSGSSCYYEYFPEQEPKNYDDLMDLEDRYLFESEEEYPHVQY